MKYCPFRNVIDELSMLFRNIMFDIYKKILDRYIDMILS